MTNLRNTDNVRLSLRWDADYYKSLSDEDCIVCLTERQIYLLGQYIEAIMWVKTRWTGDISELDFVGMAGNLEKALAESMTCETLTLLAQQVADLAAQVQSIIDTQNQGDVNITIDSTIDTVGTDTDANLGGDIEGCDHDVLWGGVNSLIDYMHAKNVDLLNELNQNIGNTALIAADLISAIPAIGALFPIDEAIDFGAFLVNELGEEYVAIADEDFLTEVKCELFCATNSGDPCGVSLDDLISLVNSHNSYTITTAATTLVDIVNFVLTGTFAGEQWFWALTSLQLQIAALGETFLDKRGTAGYELYLAAGYNNPDSDWSILCEECPPEAPTPEIVSPCFGGGAGGANLTHISGTTWSIETTHRATPDEAWTIKAVGDAVFRLANINHVAGFPLLPIAAGWKLEDNTCGAALIASAPSLATTNLKEWGYTWSDGTGVHTTEFDMIAPP